MTLKECYAILDGNYTDVMERLKDETIIIRFVKMFAKEDSISKLKHALASDDIQTALRIVHSIKGNCMSLGFTQLQKISEEIAEPLRNNLLDKALPLFVPLEREYKRTIAIIQQLAN